MQDLVRGLCPHERARVLAVVLQVLPDRLNQCSNALELPLLIRLFGNCESHCPTAFSQDEPGTKWKRNQGWRASQCLTRSCRKFRIAFLAVFVFLAVAYVGTPDGAAFPYYDSWYTKSYVPASLLRNTVALQDSPDVVRVATWLDDQGISNAVLVAHIGFVGWARVYVDTMNVYGFGDPAQVNNGNFSAYSHVYVLGWADHASSFQRQRLPLGLSRFSPAGESRPTSFLGSSAMNGPD